jgi:hypothetical protein
LIAVNPQAICSLYVPFLVKKQDPPDNPKDLFFGDRDYVRPNNRAKAPGDFLVALATAA